MTRIRVTLVAFVLVLLAFGFLGCSQFGLFRPQEFDWDPPWIGNVSHDIAEERYLEADIRIDWDAFVLGVHDAEVECRIMVDSGDWTNWSTAKRSHIFRGLRKGDHTFTIEARTVAKSADPFLYYLSLCLDGGANPPSVELKEPKTECSGNGYGHVSFRWEGSDDATAEESLRYMCIVDGKSVWGDEWMEETTCKLTQLESLNPELEDNSLMQHTVEVRVRDVCDREGSDSLEFLVPCKIGDPPYVKIRVLHSVCEEGIGTVFAQWTISDDDSSEVDLHSWWKLPPYQEDWASIPITDGSCEVKGVPNGLYTFWVRAQDRYGNTNRDTRDVDVSCDCE